MPIYEYECQDCGKVFEAFLSVKDSPVKKCAHCESENIRKLISNCSFQLKGTGWYVTDYARKDNSSGNNGNKNGAKPEGSETKTSAEAQDAKDTAKSSESTQSSETKDSGKAA